MKNGSIIALTKNQIRYYDDKIRYIELDIAEITKPKYDGTPNVLTPIEEDEIEAKRDEIKRYEKLRSKEMKKLKKLEKM